MASLRPAAVPATLLQQGAGAFWLAICLTGLGAGLGAGLLTLLLDVVQHAAWPGSEAGVLAAAEHATAWRHILVLSAAGLIVGFGQWAAVRLVSGNGIDITTAIWFHAGRLPVVRTLWSAVLSVVIVGLGVSLGREGAPKQVGAVLANALSDRVCLSDEQRRLLVACGAGAGMAAAYGVPLGGALFALEVLRGVLALRLVLPALLCASIATAVVGLILPDTPTYLIPAFETSPSVLVWTLLAGPIAGFVSVGYVRAVAWAERHKPGGWSRLVVPVFVMAAIGVVSTAFPQLLGNGRDIAQLSFTGQVAPSVLMILLVLKPFVTVACLGCGAPGGLFTPSLAFGALLGGLLGSFWSVVWPGVPPGLFAVIGAAAVLAATTQGPISTVVLIMEMTGRDRAFFVPLLLAVVTATLVSRTIEARSIYDARLTDEQVEARLALREPPAPRADVV